MGLSRRTHAFRIRLESLVSLFGGPIKSIGVMIYPRLLSDFYPTSILRGSHQKFLKTETFNTRKRHTQKPRSPKILPRKNHSPQKICCAFFLPSPPQHLKSEQAALRIILEEKDLELLNARKKLEELNQEIGELRKLMNNREDQLIQATAMLKEKDEHVQMIQDELNDTRLKFSEAETVVERIAELTNKLVISIKDENSTAVRAFDDMSHESPKLLVEKPQVDFSMRKRQLETELKLTRESLKMKEMEVLAVQRALTLKDEELKNVIQRLDARERELKGLKKEMKEDVNDMKKLYILAQERIGDRSIGDLAIEKLQLEAAQLEVEAATCALSKLADMSRELLNKASLSLESDSDVSVFPQNGTNTGIGVVEHNECFPEVKCGVARLSALTEQLVHEAGITTGAE